MNTNEKVKSSSNNSNGGEDKTTTTAETSKYSLETNQNFIDDNIQSH